MTEAADTRKAAVLRPSEIKSHDRGGGASTTPLVNASIGATAFINGITSFGPGTVIAFHSHNCEESVMLSKVTRCSISTAKRFRSLP